jgi:SAM-dependent methyltransferase
MGEGIVDMNEVIFKEVWEKGNYRLGSTAQRLVPYLSRILPVGAEINDYGCGTGRADVLLLKAGYKINMVDFVDNALEKEARSFIGKGLNYFVAPLWKLPDNFPVVDWGICINVLMTVDPERLEEIQKEMRRTCRNLIVEAYDWEDIRLGRDMTTIKMDADGWAKEMNRYWTSVEKIKSPENPRRYITVCRA